MHVHGHDAPNTVVPNPQSAEPFVGYRDAAAYLGVAVGTLYSWVSARRIRFYRIGPRCIRFRISELRDWLDARVVAPSPDSNAAADEDGIRGGQ
jgi:excisionase family DNA binding protein